MLQLDRLSGIRQKHLFKIYTQVKVIFLPYSYELKVDVTMPVALGVKVVHP